MVRKRKRIQFSTVGPSRAKQSFKDECDVNNVMKRFEATGMIDHLSQHQGSYGDFTNAPESYQDALHRIQAAQDMFMSLPAKVRARFSNDPGEFLNFVESPENVEELVKLGLATRRPEAEAEAPKPEPEPPADPPKADT